MREITDHKLNGLNDVLKITVLDEPGQGGANHVYEIDQVGGAPSSGGSKLEIKFQNGPILEFGVNGISNESLIAVVIDRLRGFQSGKFACRDNAIALTLLEDSLMRLQKRTRDRMARQVEGTNVV